MADFIPKMGVVGFGGEAPEGEGISYVGRGSLFSIFHHPQDFAAA